METGKTYKFGGAFYTVIDGVVMVKTRLHKEWKRSIVNNEGNDPEFFSNHVALRGEIVA